MLQTFVCLQTSPMKDGPPDFVKVADPNVDRLLVGAAHFDAARLEVRLTFSSAEEVADASLVPVSSLSMLWKE